MMAALLLVLAFILGGASQQHAVRLALLELAALPIGLVAIRRLVLSGEWSRHRAPLALLAGLFAIPLLQILPLPPSLWTRLPGREEMVLALELAEQPLGWAPLSVTPEATWGSMLALIPPAALFLIALTLPQARRAELVILAVICAVFSIVLGAAQLFSGEALYPYATTDAGNVVGMFANRNHLATLGLMLLPLSAALALQPPRPDRLSGDAARWVYGTFAVLVIVAVCATRSRAGVVLLGPALIGGFIVMWWSMRGAGDGRKLLLWGLAPLAGIAAVLAFGLAPLIARFGAVMSDGVGRFENWPYVIEASNRYQPLGAGVGSFDPVFRSVEPLERLDPTYFNHAHNEYLEIWLESGVPGLILMALMLAWFGRTWFATWSRGRQRGSDLLARAAGVSILMVLAHSVVDYPWRTDTIMVMIALCAALMIRDPAPREPA